MNSNFFLRADFFGGAQKNCPQIIKGLLKGEENIVQNKKEIVEWGNKKLKEFMDKRITLMFGKILDFAETAVDSKYRYGVLRGKILKEANEALRSIKSELDRNYEVIYTRVGEDVIKVKPVTYRKDGGK